MSAYFVRLNLAAELGEGLHWDPVRGGLWLVDIHGQRIIFWDAVSDAWTQWVTPQRVGWVIPCADGHGVLAGFQEGVARVELPSGARSADIVSWVIRPFEGRSALRLNDAKADAFGAIWCGSLNNDDESRPEGALFRLAPDGAWCQHDEGYKVTNGPAIHPDGRLMLHTDSARRTIYAFDLDAGAGRLANKRVWRVFSEMEGYPDGMTFDADGCVWVAHWGAACVSRFALDGSLMRRVHLSTSHITNVCFGGPRLDRLFVTSARAGLSPVELAAQPTAGALFEIDSEGTRGVAASSWGQPSRVDIVERDDAACPDGHGP